MKFFKITHIAAGAVLAALAATGQASADQGTIMNVHVGLGGQEGGAAGGCVAFDLVRTDQTVTRYAVGGAQLAGPLYQQGILTHQGQMAGLDPQSVPSNCGGGLPTFQNLNFPPNSGQ
jgi:hypothetical protein